MMAIGSNNWLCAVVGFALVLSFQCGQPSTIGGQTPAVSHPSRQSRQVIALTHPHFTAAEVPVAQGNPCFATDCSSMMVLEHCARRPHCCAVLLLTGASASYAPSPTISSKAVAENETEISVMEGPACNRETDAVRPHRFAPVRGYLRAGDGRGALSRDQIVRSKPLKFQRSEDGSVDELVIGPPSLGSRSSHPPWWSDGIRQSEPSGPGRRPVQKY
jgi:hypothetical protein